MLTVLMARFGYFGDVILTLPLVDGLARSPRVCAVDVLTTTQYAEIFDADPRIGRCVAVDRDRPRLAADELARLRYDVFVDLHSTPGDEPVNRARAAVRAGTRIGFAHSARPELTHPVEPRRAGEHAVACYLRAFEPLGLTEAGPGGLVLRADEVRAARRLLDPIRPVVCLLPGSRHAWRRWPLERFAELAGELHRGGWQPVIAGHEFDRTVVTSVAAASGGATPYVTDDARALAALFAAAGVAVGANSGLVHLAAAAGARVVCLQSHLDPRMWGPWGPGHVQLTGSAPAKDCGCVVNEQGDLSLPCGRTITPAAVLDAVHRIGGVR